MTTKAEVAAGKSEHIWKCSTGLTTVAQLFHNLKITSLTLITHSCHFNYHSGPKLSVWVSAILP